MADPESRVFSGRHPDSRQISIHTNVEYHQAGSSTKRKCHLCVHRTHIQRQFYFLSVVTRVVAIKMFKVETKLDNIFFLLTEYIIFV